MSDTEPEAVPPEPPPAAQEGTFTQDQVDKLMGRVRNEGRTAVLAELGADSIDTLKERLEAQAAREEAEKSETERARDEAQAARADAEQARAQAAAAQLAVRVDRALIDAGASPATLGHLAKLVDVAPEVDDDTLIQTIDSLRSEVAPLFAQSEGAPPAPSSVPSGGTGAKPPSSKSALEAGAERAALRFGTP